MGFMKPKIPKTPPPEPVIVTPQPFDPNPAQATRPQAATQGSADSNFGARGTTTLINSLAPRAEQQKRRTLLGGA